MAPAKVGGDDRKHFDVPFGSKIHNPHLNTDAQSTHITTDIDRDTVNATIHAPHTITPEILSTAAHAPQIITPEMLSFMRTHRRRHHVSTHRSTVWHQCATGRRPQIKGVAATPVRAVGETTVQFTIQGTAFAFDFLILPCDTKTILGLKF
jgi:hypothetical protein